MPPVGIRTHYMPFLKKKGLLTSMHLHLFNIGDLLVILTL
jgi:hypothetical protein